LCGGETRRFSSRLENNNEIMGRDKWASRNHKSSGKESKSYRGRDEMRGLIFAERMFENVRSLSALRFILTIIQTRNRTQNRTHRARNCLPRSSIREIVSNVRIFENFRFLFDWTISKISKKVLGCRIHRYLFLRRRSSPIR